MKKHQILPAALMLSGFALITIGVLRGDASVGLFLVIPYVSTSSPIAGLGALLVFLGFAALQFSGLEYLTEEIPEDYSEGFPRTDYSGTGKDFEQPYPYGKGVSENYKHVDRRVDEQSRTEKKAKGGGIIFIGPIPIIFGDSSSVKFLLPAGILIMILLVLVWFFS